MNLGSCRPGTSTSFVDSASDEAVLQLAMDPDGTFFMALHLYDAAGSLIADAPLEHVAGGLTVSCARGEVLLVVPCDPSVALRYRLYNSQGNLLTTSDGARTMIHPLLRMEGVRRNWAPPVAPPGVP